METEAENKTEKKKAMMRNALIEAFDQAWVDHVGELITNDDISLGVHGEIRVVDDSGELIAERSLEELLNEYIHYNRSFPSVLDLMASKLERLSKKLRAQSKKAKVKK